MRGTFKKSVCELSAHENEEFTTLIRAKYSTLQKLTFTEDSIAFFDSNLKHSISLVLLQIHIIG